MKEFESSYVPKPHCNQQGLDTGIFEYPCKIST